MDEHKCKCGNKAKYKFTTDQEEPLFILSCENCKELIRKELDSLITDYLHDKIVLESEEKVKRWDLELSTPSKILSDIKKIFNKLHKKIKL